MKVSMLMPSRQRVGMAIQSIESLGDGDFEVLLGVDHDDPSLKEYKAIKHPKVKLIEFDSFGYEKLWVYYNGLAENAKGDWLFLWNDDATMCKPNWIDKITNFNHKKPIVLSPYHPENNLFPVISRAWYETTGHFALSTHVDSWVQDIGNQTDTMFFVDGVEIIHEGEALFDPTHNRVREVVRETAEHHRSDEMQTIRDKEAKMIVKQLLKGGYRNADNNEV